MNEKDNVAVISLKALLKTFSERFKECSKMYNALKNRESSYANQISFMIGYYSMLVEFTAEMARVAADREDEEG